MTAALAVLNPAALVTLADCELRIERGLKSFIDVGEALATIRDSRLYRRSHATFEDYCAERWNLKRQRAYELMNAAALVSEFSDTDLPAPAKEAHAAALAAVPEPERAEVWRQTVERTNGKPTAAAVRAVQTERTQTPGPVDAAATPPAGSGTTPEPIAASGLTPPAERHLTVVPERPVPPPGSPATWTPEQHEQNRLEIQRVQIIERAQRRAPRLVAEIRGLVNDVLAGINLGETGLVTPQTIADIRAVIDILEARMEATQ